MSDAITITQTITVSDQDCWDVLTTALEGDYMEEFEVLDVTRRDEGYREVTRMLVDCAEEMLDDPVEIDAGKVREGLVRFAQWVAVSDPCHNSYLGTQFAVGLSDGWGYLDAIGADAVLQFAVFGAVIYG